MAGCSWGRSSRSTSETLPPWSGKHTETWPREGRAASSCWPIRAKSPRGNALRELKRTEQMRAVTFQGLHTPLAFETLPDPTPDAGQVVVKVGFCGICGSDLHMTEDAAYGCKHGDVLGHEFAGEVVGLGREVTGLRAGDLVS